MVADEEWKDEGGEEFYSLGVFYQHPPVWLREELFLESTFWNHSVASF